MALDEDVIFHRYGHAVERAHDLSRFCQMAIQIVRPTEPLVEKDLSETVGQILCDGCNVAEGLQGLHRSILAHTEGLGERSDVQAHDLEFARAQFRGWEPRDVRQVRGNDCFESPFGPSGEARFPLCLLRI